MSGFEIAGIILGAFLLLVNSARYVRTGLENSKSWWLFETTFADFVSKVETQEIAYCQVLKQLAGLLDITDEEYEGLWKGSIRRYGGNFISRRRSVGGWTRRNACDKYERDEPGYALLPTRSALLYA